MFYAYFSPIVVKQLGFNVPLSLIALTGKCPPYPGILLELTALTHFHVLIFHNIVFQEGCPSNIANSVLHRP